MVRAAQRGHAITGRQFQSMQEDIIGSVHEARVPLHIKKTWVSFPVLTKEDWL